MLDIPFNQIPAQLRLPGIFIETDASKAGRSFDPGRILFVGQAVAIVALAVANTPVQVASKVQAEAMFGVGSMLSAMVAAARVADPFGLFYCLPLADAGGAVAATGTITVSTPPTAAGSIPLYIGDKKVSVAGIETVAQTATAIANAINAQSDLPVMSAAAAGVVTLTARN